MKMGAVLLLIFAVWFGWARYTEYEKLHERRQIAAQHIYLGCIDLTGTPVEQSRMYDACLKYADSVTSRLNSEELREYEHN